MKRTIETKFWNFSQNNSGGYFVSDEIYGVCEEIIVEAQTSDEAWSRLESIGENVSGFWNSCSCCGDRWSNWLDDDDGEDVPSIYGEPLDKVECSYLRGKCFVHYCDGTIEEFIFKNKD